MPFSRSTIPLGSALFGLMNSWCSLVYANKAVKLRLVNASPMYKRKRFALGRVQRALIKVLYGVISEKVEPMFTTASNAGQEWVTMAIWRIEKCKVEAGYRSHASIYGLIRLGLWTQPVKIGERSSGWPDNEVQAINAARIAGKTDEQIRELVRELHAKRSEKYALMFSDVGGCHENI